MQGSIRIGRMTLEIPVASNIGEPWKHNLPKQPPSLDSGGQVPHGKQCFVCVIVLSARNYTPANLKA